MITQYNRTVFFILLFLAVNSCQNKTITAKSSNKKCSCVIVDKNDSLSVLVQGIDSICRLPTIYSTRNSAGQIDSLVVSCGDQIFWNIVTKGKSIIPYLIEKTKDTCLSMVKDQCDTFYLKRNIVSFLILEKILAIPYAEVFSGKFCTIDFNCNYGLTYQMIYLANNHPQKMHDDLESWYVRNKANFKEERIYDPYDCFKNHNIEYKLTK